MCEKGLSVGSCVERCQRWQVAQCLYNLSVKKKGAIAFEISSPAETDQPAIVTPGEKFAFLLTEMISPSRKKKKIPLALPL